MQALRLFFFAGLSAAGVLASCGFAGSADVGGMGGGSTETEGTSAPSPWGFPGGGSKDGAGGSAGPTPGGLGGGMLQSTATPAAECDWPKAEPADLMDPRPGALHSGPYARALSDAGVFPLSGTVQLGELLAYYPVATKPAAKLGMTASLEELGNGQYMLEVAVQTPVTDKRDPLAVAIVVDTSVSMMGDALDRARASAAALVRGVQPTDMVTVLTSSGAVVVPPKARDADALSKAADAAAAIPFDAGEDLGGAVDDAYASIQKMRDAGLAGAPGRVVIITDGGASDVSVPLGTIAKGRGDGILLGGVGVGDARAYDVSLLDLATYNGGGPLLFVDSKAEATATLTGRFDELFRTWATDLKVTVELPQGVRLVAPPTVPPVSEGNAVQFVGSAVGPGRTLVFRRTLETCWDPTTFKGLSPSLTVWANGALAEPSYQGAFEKILASNIGDAEALLLHRRTSLIAAYADALESLDRVKFEAVVGLANEGLAIKSDDPTFGAIHDLAQRDYDLLVPGGK